MILYHVGIIFSKQKKAVNIAITQPNSMSLAAYKEKRNFKKSPEPKGGKATDNKLRFVVQKHDASHLHYDFRLEMEGVLKSWAVPKGPSTDPKIKRLAIMVEDHPYDYRNFEGIIPIGYGAGTVMIWDEGYYEPIHINDSNKKIQDSELRKQFHLGKITFILRGKKLKGEYALIKSQGRVKNGWLLFKVKDKYASEEDITLKNKSVVSKKTLEQIEKTSTNLLGVKLADSTKGNNNKEISTTKVVLQKSKPEKKNEIAIKKLQKKNIEPQKVISDQPIAAFLKDVPKSKYTLAIKPMLATLIDQPFDSGEWLFEIKWDGYRALAFLNKKKVELRSRNDKSFNKKFYPLIASLMSWNINAIVDGEVVVIDEYGISNFGALQNWRSEADGELMFYVFDVLWLDGKNLTDQPLIMRREVLKAIMPSDNLIRLSEAFEGSGTDFFEAAKKMGLEGIIAKKLDGKYYPGNRTKEWLKVKAQKRQEMVIGGYTKNKNSGKAFSSILVGVFDKGALIYTGKVGTGFNAKIQQEMLNQFKPLVVTETPFSYLPDINKPSHFRPNPTEAEAFWLKPELVCEVTFAEMTRDGIMRHPSFRGIRMDKNAKDVIREKEITTRGIIKDNNSLKKSKLIIPNGKKTRKTFLNPTDETQVRMINGKELKFTNLSKIYWPKEKITKRDMLNYYYQVAPYILPYLKNRPQSMNRHPNGINGESFYYRDVTGKAPGWLETYLYHNAASSRDRHYLVAKDEASLLYMASLGCIEMNPWSSRVNTEDYPDWCIIDLDPGKTTFEQVIEAARVTKDVLDSMKVRCYPKTSGSKGIHIYIPLGAKYTYEQSKEFARSVATLVTNEITGFTTIKRAVKDRNGKMYIDFLQNRPQATVSAPYSLRPKPGATVSMPLYWEEVKKGLKMTDFTIFNALDRIRSEGDIFKPVLGKGGRLDKILTELQVM